MKTLGKISLALFAAFGAMGAAQAAEATTTFNVTATVLKACKVTATNMAFGDYDPTATAAKTASSALTVTCTNGTPYSFKLGVASGSAFEMANGASKLPYSLKVGAGDSKNPGAAIAFNTDLANSYAGDGQPQTINLDGSIAAGILNLTGGNHSQTLTVTVTY